MDKPLPQEVALINNPIIRGNSIYWRSENSDLLFNLN